MNRTHSATSNKFTFLTEYGKYIATNFTYVSLIAIPLIKS